MQPLPSTNPPPSLPSIQIPGCQKTQQMISDIMNQLMRALGSQTNLSHRLIIESKINSIKQIQQRLQQWKYDTLFDLEQSKTIKLECLEQQIQNKQREIAVEKQMTDKLFADLKKFIYLKTMMSLLAADNERLKEVDRSLEQIAGNLFKTKLEVDKCNEEVNLRVGKTASTLISEKMDGVMEKMLEGSRKKREDALQESKIVEKQIAITQQKLEKVKIRVEQEERRRKGQRRVKSSNQGTQKVSVDQIVDFNILKVQSSKSKLGEAVEGEIRYQKLQQKKEFWSEIQIYITALVFILLFHYVIF